MNIVHAGNARGKTQFVQAAIYCLGLERMLSARANAPLGSALTDELRVIEGGSEVAQPVIQSWTAIELANADGDVITVQRYVKDSVRRQDLVRVWREPAISQASAAEPADYFLHNAGSATRELGFHTLLADFLGWDLPTVPRFTGGESLLYLDVIFPFLVVDQQSWSSSAPRKVGRYQISQPLRRAAEFLLDMEGPAAAAERAKGENRLASLRANWLSERTGLMAFVSAAGARVLGIPEQPNGSTAVRRTGATPATSLRLATVEVESGGEWLPFEEASDRLRQLRDAKAKAAPPVSADQDLNSSVNTEELAGTRKELDEVLAAARLMESELTLSEAQLATLTRRLSGLGEERRRNQDVKTLVRLGSDVHADHIGDHNCPTCRQSLDEVEADDMAPGLDVDGNLRLLNAQIATTEKMRARLTESLDPARASFTALQRRADQLRVQINSYEADLGAPSGQPSRGEIANQVTQDLRLRELARAQDEFERRVTVMQEVANEIAAVRDALRALPSGIPPSDEASIFQVENVMRALLQASGFRSYGADEVGLDEEDLVPTRDRFDLDVDVSASDVVRTKIAYLQAVRQVGVERARHPGLLILDEPRQQDMEAPDFGAILQYLSASDPRQTQTIITSATPTDELAVLLGDFDVIVNMIDLGTGRVLQPTDEPDLGSNPPGV